MESLILKDSRKLEHILHPSTKAAIFLLNEVVIEPVDGKPCHILDVGSGSGLLSLIAAQKWPNSMIISSDISTNAVKDCKENIEANGLSERIKVLRADGLDHSEIHARAPYALIVANLLAKWHIEYLADMQSHLREGGEIILSGILPWRMQEIEALVSHTKLHIINHTEIEGWVAVKLGS